MGALVLALVPTWPGALCGAVVFGIGYGVYLSVDFALCTEVLPAATARAKDLGVINIAVALPQVFAPFGGFADDCPVVDGRVALPDAPGIGFERKADLWAVMKEIA